ncbi:hypothetical protein BO71DRAFT_416942 [Aspergillus ellipticus CBS 707.79]|uniref:Fungal-specific transcription factor domain-containing protein n=1 Tax=Aspergillus ellipticus CBS 707.79 TaxID=1448320 RepID=A0A319DJB1_9EURO|nr:hypothetical protein BO71DRAFT_416942 [Aspergillus ellipticus CBS 707.79]
MQLSWQPGFSLSRKPFRRSRAPRPIATPVAGQQQFEFIVEHPVGDHEASSFEQSGLHTGSDSCYDGFSVANRAEPHHVHHSTNRRSLSPGSHSGHRALPVEDIDSSTDVVSGELPVTDNFGLPDLPTDLPTIDEITERRPFSSGSEDESTYVHPCSPSTNTQLQQCDEAILNLDFFQESTPFSMSVSPGILYRDLFQRFQPALERYNEEFCRIPLTTDLEMNPFRYRANLDPEPMFLVHSVMALAAHHVESTSTQTHRHAALQLLRKGINAYGSFEYGHSILDAIILLFSLDETQSALGHWRTHLLGAYGLFEACGGIEKWVTSARTQVQIGMLLWWDAITSLANREDCVFPHAYFEALLSKYTGKEWDFFGLCGCPLNLVKVVMRLARLSAEKRRSSFMQYIIFDTPVVSEIEQSLESWHHVSPPAAFQDEESMQKDLDNMHCSEAWRNGLLLYLYRVFRWEPGCRVPMHVIYRARVIKDHVVACREEHMISRQALLPLFFAACELQDPSSRKQILKLCSTWNDRTRYYMFGTTIPLLQEVWAEQSAKGFENVWWGQIIDKQHMLDGDSPLQMRLCFG